MTDTQAKEVLDKIIDQICGYKNPFSLEQFRQKYAFDVRLPSQVNDSTTGEVTWAQSTNPTKFITIDNARKRNDVDDWVLPKRPLNSIQDILNVWQEVNAVTTERAIESQNFSKSDNVYNSENVYHSQDIHFSKNVLFSDGLWQSEFVAAAQRNENLTYCARVEDSKECTESFNVSWSGKIAKSLFIHDSYDLFECMFCSHMAGKKFCIANMQFEESEYRKLKDLVIKWVLTS